MPFESVKADRKVNFVTLRSHDETVEFLRVRDF